MNTVDQLLRDDMNRLLDRIAGGRSADGLVGVLATQPALRARLDEAEERLAGLRRSMLETYGSWSRAMDDLENLWAVVDCRRELVPIAA
jgi:hypothetical protein